MEPFNVSGHDLEEVLPGKEPVVAAATISRGKFDWPRLHPYTSAVIGAVLLILAGASIVSWRSSVGPSGSGNGAWANVNTNLLNPAYSGPQGGTPYADQNPTNILQELPPGTSYTFIPPASQSQADSSAAGTSTNAFDFNAFIAMLSQESSSTPSASGAGDTSLQNAYSFIPSGLVSVSSQGAKRSAVQQQLYDYGNEAGTYIQAFEGSHGGETAVLKDWIEDRGNSAKTTSALELAQALQAVGLGLSSMAHVPNVAQSAHAALAKSFQEIGTNLALVVRTQNDQDLLKAIDTYNASANTYGQNYVALVNVFGAYGVRFSNDDAGSVFTFTPVSL